MIIDKSTIEQWWNNHSQDYKQDYKSEYLGFNHSELSDYEFLKYIEELDKIFAHKAYFGQKSNKPFFSNLITCNDLSNKNVLEVGCGLGSHSQALAERGCKLTSIDLASKSIEVTSRRLKLRNLKANVIKADCEKLPFDDNTFDYIWSWGVIHHTTNTHQAANEISRVLKPGGELGIMVYNNNSFYKFINVYLRYGILGLKFFQGFSRQDLKNKYTDGKQIGGAPLSKYYSKNDLINLFSDLKFIKSKCYEQKNFLTFWIPTRYKFIANNLIPSDLYSYLFKDIGFLLFARFIKINI